jgi:hypothetical protein
MSRPLLIGGGLIALYYLWPKKSTPRGIPPESMMGPNKQPSIAGFHPAGATFSVWADPTDITAARAIKIARIGEKQEWVRISGGPPYTGGYNPKARIVPFAKTPDRTILEFAREQILGMFEVKNPFPDEDAAIGGGADPNLPLVITMGNIQDVPSDLAVYEFDWDGVDPR